MKKVNFISKGTLVDKLLLASSLLIFLLTVFSLPYDFSTIVRFWRIYVGPTAIVLFPMAIFILAVTLLMPFGRVRADGLIAELVQVIYFLAPLLGFIGTLLGFSTSTIAFKHGFNTQAVAQMAVRTGQGISSTLFSIVIVAISGLIIRYGIKEEQDFIEDK